MSTLTYPSKNTATPTYPDRNEIYTGNGLPIGQAVIGTSFIVRDDGTSLYKYPTENSASLTYPIKN